LNFTKKRATYVAVGAVTKLTMMKRKIILYLLAELNLKGYIPIAVDE